MRSKSLVVLTAAFLLVASVAPAVATDGSLSVEVVEDESGVTATVTHNESTAENASVVVNATDGTYAGAGNYTTDENGSVDLPVPEENVTVDVFAEYENETATTTTELVVATVNETNETAENESFGAEVSSFVHSLLEGTDEQRRIGRLIAGWVVENNPGNAPDHAGPPNGDRGPPAFVDDGTDENETDGNATVSGAPENPGKSGERGNGNGPPEDRGSNGNGVAKGNGK